jgi:CheY-like chemotaxis protein
MKQSEREKYFIYADDDSDDRHAIIEMISDIDPTLEVVPAQNGIELIKHLQTLEKNDILPCFILLDLNMPVMNGFKTLEFLKSKNSFNSIPVIVFTTSNNPKDASLVQSLGAERFITKPFSFEEIKQITRQFADFCHTVPVRRKESI